jgi:hypothetical protein
MQPKHINFPALKALALALFVACASTVTPTEVHGLQSHAQKARNKKRDWLAVAILIEKANDVRRREMAGDISLASRRMQLFWEAAVECSKYVKNHVRVGDTVEYVVEVFRLGVLWEMAGNDNEAKNNYDKCDRRESKYSAKAFYDEERLLLQLQKRLATVNERLGKQRLQEIKTEMGGGTSQDYSG